MDKIWWLVIVFSILITIIFIRIKSQIDKLKLTIQSNKELNEKEYSLLDSKIEITNKNVVSCDLRLDNAAITIKDLTKNIEENEKQQNRKYNELIKLIEQNKSSLDNEISTLVKSIIEIKGINKELKNQLAIFTEIEADSMQLNAEDSFEKNKDFISENVDVELNAGINLDAEQTTAYNLMNDSNANLFITGKAGTGKSFLLKHFVNETKKRVLVLAPTGIAALNANGVTIHSAFGWDNLQLNIDEISDKKLKLKTEKRQVLKNVQTIIIDEISMVRADIFEKIDRILRLLNNSDLPFGGKQVLLFGDLFQLPPIADKEEIKYLKDNFGSKYFFSSNAYKNGGFKFNELTINHRQKDDAIFFEILNNIREGKISDDNLKMLNTRTKFEPEELRRVVQLFPHKGEVESINQRELDNIPAKEYSYKSKVIYQENNLTFDIEKNLPISETLKLKLGALVMMVTNDEDHRWVNGTLAIVSFIKEDCIKVKINGYEYEVLPTTFRQQESVYEDGKIIYKTIYEVEQYPIVLAYAITIHKSQGMTYKKIACNVSKCFEAGQVYVALSRCTNIEGLYLLKAVNKKILGVESEVLDFYGQAKNNTAN